MSHERIWRSVVLLLVVCLHLWLGWTWANHHPGALIAAVHSRVPSSDTVLVLTFVTRADTTPKSARPEARRALAKPLARSAPATPAAAMASVPHQPADPPARLNLAIPPEVGTNAYRRDFLEHREVLENRATRFDRAWLSDGTLVDIAAKRSAVASVILGAMGALMKPCTAKQIRNYDRACVPDQYVHRVEDDYPAE